MKKILFIILSLVFLAGCEEKSEPYGYFYAMEDGDVFDYDMIKLPQKSVEACDYLDAKINRLESELKRLQRYAECPEHKFSFQERRDGEYFQFTCSRCGLKKTLHWDELTMHQRNCYTGLIGRWADFNEVKE